MSKRKICVTCVAISEYDLICIPLVDAIAKLRIVYEDIPEAYRAGAVCKLERLGADNVELIVEWRREETEKETKDRLYAEECAKARQDLRDEIEYDRLRAKLGGSGSV